MQVSTFESLFKLGGIGLVAIWVLATIFVFVLRSVLKSQLTEKSALVIFILIVSLTFLFCTIATLGSILTSLQKTTTDVGVKTAPDSSSKGNELAVPRKDKHHTTFPPQKKALPISQKDNPIVDRKINYRTFLIDTINKKDIGVVIVGQNNLPFTSLASDISKLYEAKGFSVISPVFSYSFFLSKLIVNVKNIDNDIIEKLNLPAHLKYLVIGTYSNTFDNGTQTKFISRAFLDIVIISCEQKSQKDAFKINVGNGYDDQANAEAGAIDKIINGYRKDHLNL